ncbi:Dip2/Utp12 family-domain-containing protein [Emericellopsis atlantica]|uniref:Dip2/Utp12 family-domain-containing protein n=1 Tax=Emericellopsis atlantica TaxID=2614577 RepID=A0A9P7ZQS8_9HYPO|nr:Dip2/Utp12 family-domain-containing protein [Emericellopsis atlantica]KAG9256624.1 Dip2/Utp12 family-domain-containing protein [Emericellopsis atlantica]
MSTKRKAPGKLAPPTIKASAKKGARSAIDESKATVGDTDLLSASQQEMIEISSDADSDDDEDMSDVEGEEQHKTAQSNGKRATPKVNGNKSNDLPTPDAEERDESEDEEATSPSFGELLRSNADGIDVTAMLHANTTGAAAAQRSRTAIAPPSHQSLTTVLTQALRTDDTDLLESCLHTTDLNTIRNTIENIDSTLAGTLLTRLAARLHRRPGRAGTLMTWVQWTLIAHGGALASQPKVINDLSGLQKVLAERSKGLNSLLALKGKLDLLEGQMNMRRKMQRTGAIREDDSDDEDENVVWVEGETREKDAANGIAAGRKGLGEEDEDDEPVLNGVMGDSSDEEDDEVEEDDEDEEGEESLGEDEVDHDDVDESMGEDEDSDVEAAPPAKVQKVGKALGKRK